MLCVEPTVKLEDVSKSTEVKKILFISKDKCTLYYSDSGVTSQTFTVPDEKMGYINKLLSLAYSAETNLTSAIELQSEITTDAFNSTIKNGLTNWTLNTSTSTTETNAFEHLTTEAGIDYYGLFVLIGTGTADSQGRIIYNVCQKQTIEPLKIKIKKCDENGDSIIGAQFKIDYWQQAQSNNAKTEEIDLSQGTARTSTFNTKSTNLVKVTITETKTPENYIKAEKVELAFTWNDDSREWKLYTIYDGKDYLYTESESPSNEDYIIINGNEFEVKIKNTYNPPVTLQFYKTDISGSTNLSSAIVKISSGDNVSNITSESNDNVTKFISGVSSDENGCFGQMTVYPKSNTGTFKLKLTEEEAPDGYNKLNGGNEIELTITYNTSNGAVTEIFANDSNDSNKVFSGNFGFDISKDEDENFTGVTTIKIKDNSRIFEGFKVIKKDKSGKNTISGAEFKITFSNVTKVTIGEIGYTPKENENSLTLTGLKTAANGEITIKSIEAIEGVDTVYVKIEETASVSGYDKLPNPVNLKFTYTGSAWKLVKDTNNNALDDNYFSIKEDTLELTLKDDFKLDKLSLLKSDSVSNNAVEGAEFDIELTNIKSVNGKSYSSKLQVTTGANGNTELKNLVIDDINESITVTITETKAPVGYKKINGSIKITLERDGSGYIVTRR